MTPRTGAGLLTAPFVKAPCIVSHCRAVKSRRLASPAEAMHVHTDSPSTHRMTRLDGRSTPAHGLRVCSPHPPSLSAQLDGRSTPAHGLRVCSPHPPSLSAQLDGRSKPAHPRHVFPDDRPPSRRNRRLRAEAKEEADHVRRREGLQHLDEGHGQVKVRVLAEHQRQRRDAAEHEQRGGADLAACLEALARDEDDGGGAQGGGNLRGEMPHLQSIEPSVGSVPWVVW